MQLTVLGAVSPNYVVPHLYSAGDPRVWYFDIGLPLRLMVSHILSRLPKQPPRPTSPVALLLYIK